ncbi:MAG TPA: bifunctional tetrahydrofolate synthase/dihydrofolate synthase [Thiotrichaceae bacterium]|jgi:dihydrofolate synthase/folylpolyglutamate synthase|nr:bifunctional tetrahydrofolate synthase/dihydrofolate synthase [Thiotrichaceae bacterium]HIM08888.1 bifunctional tetrahydrofolate synthase/dihydrofolate synthase [Gammaproteobacteria bacterium]
MSNKIKSISKSGIESGQLRFNSLEKWLKWQESLHFTAIELGLERCRRVVNNMGLLKPSYNVISVAGTNGKGSSITMLDKILRNADYKIGCYTSPHLLKYNERICINGEEVSDAELCESFDRIDRARGDISLTYFEFGTIAALDLFRQHNVDLAILEVGLGGRLDAVNVLDADVALITTIDIDHQQWLGDNRECIAREKAGIFRNKALAVCSDPNPPQSLLDCAEALGTPISVSGSEYSYSINDDTWSWSSNETSLEELPRPMQYCDFQLQNAAGVLMILDKIQHEYPVSVENIKQGLNSFRLNGRMQIIPGEVAKILDVAHNRESVKVLVENLRKMPCLGKTHILVGMLKDKDHLEVFKVLKNIADSWSIVTLPLDRGCDAQTLLSDLKILGVDENVSDFENTDEALNKLQQLAVSGDRIVITGSFITVAAALRQLL